MSKIMQIQIDFYILINNINNKPLRLINFKIFSKKQK